ncbi:MAG TPA: spondin domain-containing protein [Kofleriaceae bacterium]
MARYTQAQFVLISCLGGTLAACATSDPAGDPGAVTGGLGSAPGDTSRESIGFAIRVESVTGPQTLVLPNGTSTAAPISPGILAVATAENVLFRSGVAADGSGLQSLAEDGNPCPLVAHLARRDGVGDAEFMIPNLHYRVMAKPGDRLHFAVMFVQSNDLFYSFGPLGLALFNDARVPVSGDMTRYVALWDAGTESNEVPGLGADQAPRQSAPGVGTRERKPVQPIGEVHDGFTYPATENVVRITITPDV